MEFEVPPLKPPTASQFPTFGKDHKFVLEVMIMRNHRVVRKDEELKIPFRMPSDD